MSDIKEKIKIPEPMLITDSFFIRNETPVIMLAHGIFLGWVLYIIMTYCFNVNKEKAEGRSIVITLIVSLYLVLFGIRIPNKINPILL